MNTSYILLPYVLASLYLYEVSYLSEVFQCFEVYRNVASLWLTLALNTMVDISSEKASGKSQLATALWYETESFLF